MFCLSAKQTEGSGVKWGVGEALFFSQGGVRAGGGVSMSGASEASGASAAGGAGGAWGLMPWGRIMPVK